MATKTRIVGSGNTLLYFNHKRIALLDGFTDMGQPSIVAPVPG